MNRKRALGARLRLIRESKKFSQGKFVARLLKKTGFDITAQSVSRYENGESTPDAGYLTAFVECFGVSADWLLKGEGEIYNSGKKVKVKDSYTAFGEFMELIDSDEINTGDRQRMLNSFDNVSYEDYLLLLKYMGNYEDIQRDIFQFFYLFLKNRVDKKLKKT